MDKEGILTKKCVFIAFVTKLRQIASEIIWNMKLSFNIKHYTQ